MVFHQYISKGVGGFNLLIIKWHSNLQRWSAACDLWRLETGLFGNIHRGARDMRYVRQGLHTGALPVPVVSKQWVIVARWHLHVAYISRDCAPALLRARNSASQTRNWSMWLHNSRSWELRWHACCVRTINWSSSPNGTKIPIPVGCSGPWLMDAFGAVGLIASRAPGQREQISLFNCHQQHIGWGRLSIACWTQEASAVPFGVHEHQEAVGLASNLKTRHRAFSVAMTCVILLHDFTLALRHFSSFFIFVRVRVGGKSHSP